ncbi:MAG: response regulator [Proteobacteria bacterium]|nr:response regulator [Pseudomonadota bacterium]
MRAFDWSRSALGAPDEWPQTLKSVLRMMLNSRFAMWMAWGPQGIFFCNDAYLPTVGIKRDWVLGARADQVWAEIWGDIGPRIAQVMATGRATWDEGLQLFLERSGYLEETFHTFSYSPVYDDDGCVAGMLCVVAEDTDRIIGERRLRLLHDLGAQAANAADTLDEVGARLIDVVAHGVLDVPFAALHLIDATGAALRHVASTPVAVGAQIPVRLQLDGDTSPWPLASALQSGHARQIDDFPVRCARIPDAWSEPVQTAIVWPIGGSGGSMPMGVLTLGVSPRRGLDERYRSFLSLLAAQVASRLADTQARIEERRRAEALAELDRAKSAFFSNVSHEFLTPLTLMLGPIDQMLAQPPAQLGDDMRRTLELVRRNGQRLRKLVNSLLDFSRIEAGRIETEFRRTDLAALTRDTAAAFRAAVEQAGLGYTVDCDDAVEPVWVDREMWERIVLNLVSNAFKHTFDGGITVTLGRHGDGLELAVRDTGVGIAAASLPRVFERFHRIAGARSRTQEGTGIGLALVRELVRLHGGSVSAESVVDQGSVFRVTIPFGARHLPAAARVHDEVEAAGLRVDASPFVEDAGRAGEAPPPVAAAGRERVLVVDDNADMRTYLERLLSARWDVVTAGDGLQALERLDGIDVVVTDLMMPRLDGHGLVERLRGDARWRLMPIIVLTAQAGEEARIRGLQRGADDYLVKPFAARELEARVEVQLMRQRVRRAERALDDRLAEVFRYAPVGLALLAGPRHVFEFANEAYRDLVGGRDVVGKALLEALPELEGQDTARLLDGVRNTGEPYIGRSHPVLLADPADGRLRRRCFDFVYQRIAGAASDDPGLAVICFEVTDAIEAREQAEAASRAKDEFIAMLGHELRNPLAPIVTALQLIRMQHPEVAVRERDVIDRQVRHMVRLLDDLLDVARIARGSVELRRSAVALAEVVAGAIETASPLLEKRGIVLEVDVPEDGLEVDADGERLSQVVGNLLSNAAKFTEAGRKVEVRARRAGDVAVLTVRDEGIGLADDETEAVFEVFVQGRQASHRPRGGLGLGLAIARSLAVLHGGTLTASSEGIGHGSTFVLTLPCLATAPDLPASARSPVQAMAGRGRRVLVVDDNVDAAASLADLLALWGYDVVVAHDGPSAIQHLDGRAVDMALLDIGLPVMDGYELAERIRATAAGRAIRLIALTGYGQPADRRRSHACGFDAHLVKPVDPEALAATLSPTLSPTLRGASAP